jgi:hypothetical protein
MLTQRRYVSLIWIKDRDRAKQTSELANARPFILVAAVLLETCTPPFPVSRPGAVVTLYELATALEVNHLDLLKTPAGR